MFTVFGLQFTTWGLFFYLTNNQLIKPKFYFFQPLII